MNQKLRSDAEKITKAAITAVMPGEAVVRALEDAHLTGSVTVNLKDGSTWTLTGDSYISEFDGALDGVTANGNHLYVGGKQVL